MLSIMVFHPDEDMARKAVDALKSKGYEANGTSDEEVAERFVETTPNGICLMFTTGNFSTSEWFIPPGRNHNMKDLLSIQDELKSELGEDSVVSEKSSSYVFRGGS